MDALTRRGFAFGLPAVLALPRLAEAMKPLRPVPMASGLRGAGGPTALPDGSVALTLRAAGDVIRVFANGATKVFVSPGSGLGGSALGPDGALYVAKGPSEAGAASPRAGILRLDLAAGSVRMLADHAPSGALRGPSALVFDRHGDIWFTDAAEGAVYCCRVDGSQISRVVAGVPGAGAITLSADQDTLFVGQAGTRQITAYPIARRGTLAVRRGQVRAHLVGTLPPGCAVVALATEAGGRLIAACGAGGLVVITPSGRIVTQQQVGIAPTGLAFSGAHPHTLFVAGDGASAQDGRLLSVHWPRMGRELSFD